EAHVRMPHRCLVRKDVDPEQTPDHAVQSLQHSWQLEVLLHLLVGEGIALFLELLGNEGDVPGFERIEPEALLREAGELRQVALAEGAGAGGEVAEEVDDLRGRLGHLRQDRKSTRLNTS